MTDNTDDRRGESCEIIGRLRHIMALKHLTQRGLAGLLRLDPSNLSKVVYVFMQRYIIYIVYTNFSG